MKIILSCLGLACSIAALIVSAGMNWQFGAALGKSPLDSNLYGALSVAADGLKILTPFFLVWAIRSKHYGQAMAAICVLFICVGYSITSGIGYSASNRGAVNLTQNTETTLYMQSKAILDTSIARNKQINEDLKLLSDKAKKRGYAFKSERRSKTNLLAEKERNHALIAKHGDKIRFAAINVRAANTASEQTEVFASLLQVEGKYISLGLILLLVLVAELVTTLGPYVSLGHLKWKKSDSKESLHTAAPANGKNPDIQVTPVQLEAITQKATPELHSLENIRKELTKQQNNVLEFPTKHVANEVEPDFNRSCPTVGGFIQNNYEHVYLGENDTITGSYMKANDLYKDFRLAFPKTQLSKNKFCKLVPTCKIDDQEIDSRRPGGKRYYGIRPKHWAKPVLEKIG